MLRFLQVVGIFAVLPAVLFLIASAQFGSWRLGWRLTHTWLKHMAAFVLIAAVLSLAVLGLTPFP